MIKNSEKAHNLKAVRSNRTPAIFIAPYNSMSCKGLFFLVVYGI